MNKKDLTKQDLDLAYSLIKENSWSPLETSTIIDDATELVAACLKTLENIKQEIGLEPLQTSDYEKIITKCLYH